MSREEIVTIKVELEMVEGRGSVYEVRTRRKIRRVV